MSYDYLAGPMDTFAQTATEPEPSIVDKVLSFFKGTPSAADTAVSAAAKAVAPAPKITGTFGPLLGGHYRRAKSHGNQCLDTNTQKFVAGSVCAQLENPTAAKLAAPTVTSSGRPILLYVGVAAVVIGGIYFLKKKT